MKKILTPLLFLTFGLMTTTTFARNIEDIPSVIPGYALNVVLVETCKQKPILINLKPMDQKKVYADYLKEGGKREFFVEDIRKFTAFHTKNLSYYKADALLEYCKTMKDVDNQLDYYSPEKTKERQIKEQEKSKNPLFF